MPETQTSKSNILLTFLGCLGAFLVFVLIIFIAYLPNRPERVDAQVYATRQAKADESRAAGVQKLTNYELIDAEAGTARIPIEEAISLTIAGYSSGEGLFAPTETPLLEIESVSVEELELPIEDSSATAEEAFDIETAETE
ncbi:MAG: hypothetical protein ACJ0BK_00465 [Coraliomargaritaceae bacterium]